MKKIIISLSIFFTLIALFVIPTVVFLLRGMQEVLSEEITAIDVSTLEDGIYIGEYTKYRWKNTVEITIVNGEITSIQVINDMRMVDEQVRSILFNRVIEENKLDVDVVAGATVTSIAYLKAIEDALSN